MVDRRRVTGLGVILLVLLGLVGPLPSAAAAGPRPGPPRGVQVTSVSDSGFSVAARRAARATSYSLVVSPSKKRLKKKSKISRFVRRGLITKRTSKSPFVTVSGLRYRTAPYYWRFATQKGKRIRYSRIYSTGLSAPRRTVSTPASASPPPAPTSVPWPGPPEGVRTTSVSGSGMVVSLQPSRAASYELYVSSDRRDLELANISRARVFSSTLPTIAASGLAYQARPHHWRVATVNGPHRYFSPFYETSLRPATPSAVSVRADRGVSITWSAVPATHFVVAQSTDPGMAVERRTYSVGGAANQFTPTGLSPGVRYYFQVKAANGSTGSSWSAPVSAVAAHEEVPIRIASYNLMVLSADGSTPSGVVVAPWLPSRRDAAAELVRSSLPDVVAVQEASQYTGSTWYTPRQVDTFAEALGAGWKVAHTQGLWNEPDYRLAGSHVVFRDSVLAAVGDGGNWELRSGVYAAFQEFQHRATGARFILISTHLTTRSGSANDELRRSEAQTLVVNASALAAARGGIPVIYAGDFGSVRTDWSPNDTPGAVMLAGRIADSIDVAQRRTNERYSSVNQYRRTPVVGAGSVDRIFASPGIGVTSWNQLLNLSGEQFAGVIPSDHNPVVVDVLVPALR